jgi:hypothetical protein
MTGTNASNHHLLDNVSLTLHARMHYNNIAHRPTYTILKNS